MRRNACKKDTPIMTPRQNTTCAICGRDFHAIASMVGTMGKCQMTDLDLFAEAWGGRIGWLGKTTQEEHAAAVERGKARFCMAGPLGDWIRAEVAQAEIDRLDRLSKRVRR